MQHVNIHRGVGDFILLPVRELVFFFACPALIIKPRVEPHELVAKQITLQDPLLKLPRIAKNLERKTHRRRN